jgi:hypothetical protein
MEQKGTALQNGVLYFETAVGVRDQKSATTSGGTSLEISGCRDGTHKQRLKIYTAVLGE